MAKVYNPTRLMLDANTMSALIDKGREREDARNRMIASGIAGILRGGQEAIERGNRRAMMEGGDWENPSEWGDKEYEAAKESFINTGDVSALNSYKMRKMQEREQKMRENELATRKTLAEIENRRGKEEANKVRESQIDEEKTALYKAIVQAESENVTPDVRMNGEIDIEARRKKLSDLGNPISDKELEELRKKYREKNVKGKSIKTGAEGEVVGEEEVAEDGGLYGYIRGEADIEARKRIFKDEIAKAKRNGISDAEKAELADAAEKASNETSAAKRDNEFLDIKKNIAGLVTREDIDRKEKALADEYEALLKNPKGSARLEAAKRKDPKRFESMKKAHDKRYGKGK